MKIFKFLLPVFLLIMGVQVTRDYFGNTSKAEKSNLGQLIADGTETIAVLDEQYKEKTIKIAKIPVKTYEVGYTFKVTDVEYKGVQTLKSPPTQPMVKVKYLASDPNVNAVDPEGELASLQEHEGSFSTLLIGLALLIAGLGLGYYRYKVYVKAKASS